MRYYKRVDGTGKTICVESYSHNEKIPGAIEIGVAEFRDYMESLPVTIELSPVDKLELRVKAIEDKLKGT